jgi:hypothetical protein
MPAASGPHRLADAGLTRNMAVARLYATTELNLLPVRGVSLRRRPEYRSWRSGQRAGGDGRFTPKVR